MRKIFDEGRLRLLSMVKYHTQKTPGPEGSPVLI